MCGSMSVNGCIACIDAGTFGSMICLCVCVSPCVYICMHAQLYSCMYVYISLRVCVDIGSYRYRPYGVRALCCGVSSLGSGEPGWTVTRSWLFCGWWLGLLPATPMPPPPPPPAMPVGVGRQRDVG